MHIKQIICSPCLAQFKKILSLSPSQSPLPSLFSEGCAVAGCVYCNEVRYELLDVVLSKVEPACVSNELPATKVKVLLIGFNAVRGHCIETETPHQTPLLRMFNDPSPLFVLMWVCVVKSGKERDLNAHYDLPRVLLCEIFC